MADIKEFRALNLTLSKDDYLGVEALLRDSDLSIYRRIYNDLLEHGKLYRNVISTYVIYRDHVKEIILSEMDDTEPIYPGFYQQCMMRGYEHPRNRIENNLDNKEYFSHEFTETNDS